MKILGSCKAEAPSVFLRFSVKKNTFVKPFHKSIVFINDFSSTLALYNLRYSLTVFASQKGVLEEFFFGLIDFFKKN